jgi:hypothetical protein
VISVKLWGFNPLCLLALSYSVQDHDIKISQLQSVFFMYLNYFCCWHGRNLTILSSVSIV